MIRKIFLALISIFLAFQSYKFFPLLREVEIPSVGVNILIAWIANMFVTGVFAFAGFGFPTQKLLPLPYYKIKNPNLLTKVFKVLKVELFREFLLATVWKNKDQRKKFFNGKKSGIEQLTESSMKSEFGHLIPLIILMIMGVYFIFIGKFILGISILAFNFLGNFYPIVLQRHHRMRIKKIQFRNRKR